MAAVADFHNTRQDGLPAPTNAIIRSPLSPERAASRPSGAGSAFLQAVDLADISRQRGTLGLIAIFASDLVFRSLRLSVRTPPFHGGESGSIPLGSASFFLKMKRFQSRRAWLSTRALVLGDKTSNETSNVPAKIEALNGRPTARNGVWHDVCRVSVEQPS